MPWAGCLLPFIPCSAGYCGLRHPPSPGYNGREVMAVRLFESIFGGISDEAFCLLSGTLKTGCVMLLCSLALLIHTGGLRPDTRELYYLAAQLESNAAGLLLTGNFAALFLESRRRG